MKVIRAIIAKELSEVFRNRMLVLTSLLPALMFLVIPVAIGVLGGGVNTPGGRISPRQMSDTMAGMAPELSGLPEATLGQIYIFRQFVIFLLIIPVMTALTIAVHSIIGEKQSRSLEPLLATPISSVQLLVAKSLSSALPAIALTWILFILYAACIRVFALPQVLTHVLTPITYSLIGLMGPLVAVLGLSLGVIVSSRVNDPRTAQQVGGLVILPIVALFAGQMQGFFYLTLPIVFAAAAALAAIDIVIIGIGVNLFDRETILVRWK